MSKTIRVYSAAELKKKYPDAFSKAFQHYQDTNDIGVPWGEEIMDSLKAVFEHSGINLWNWNIGAYSMCHVKFDLGNAGDLRDQRALAWIENNLLSQFRIKDNSLIKYNQGYPKGVHPYSIGQIKPCPFTGVCFDEDFIESLLSDIKAGCTLSAAYHNLADKAGKLFEAEIESQNSEENFLEQGYEFTKDGTLV